MLGLINRKGGMVLNRYLVRRWPWFLLYKGHVAWELQIGPLVFFWVYAQNRHFAFAQGRRLILTYDRLILYAIKRDLRRLLGLHPYARKEDTVTHYLRHYPWLTLYRGWLGWELQLGPVIFIWIHKNKRQKMWANGRPLMIGRDEDWLWAARHSLRRGVRALCRKLHLPLPAPSSRLGS